MKIAREMFEDLGYKFYENHPNEDLKLNTFTTQETSYLRYVEEKTINEIYYAMTIKFMLWEKKVQISGFERGKDYQMQRNPILNMQEIQAINKQIEELRWNNDKNKDIK